MTDIVSSLNKSVRELHNDWASSSEKSLRGFSGVLNDSLVFSLPSSMGTSTSFSLESTSLEQAMRLRNTKPVRKVKKMRFRESAELRIFMARKLTVKSKFIKTFERSLIGKVVFLWVLLRLAPAS